MNNNCQCKFIENLDDIIDHSVQTVAKNINELEAALDSVNQ